MSSGEKMVFWGIVFLIVFIFSVVLIDQGNQRRTMLECLKTHSIAECKAGLQ